MSARRILAVACAALALTFASSSAALAYSPDSAKAPSTTDDPCAASPTVIRGTNGADTIDATKAPYNPTIPYTICTFGGDDHIIANNAGDTIYAGPGNDTITGGSGGDTIYGEGGDDVIYGEGGSDHIYGQTGNDTIYANDQDNTDDSAIDFIDGGNGHNMCHYIVGEDKVTNC